LPTCGQGPLSNDGTAAHMRVRDRERHAGAARERERERERERGLGGIFTGRCTFSVSSIGERHASL
jgi:hypothetical protein